jgi:N-acetyl-gamma-glutamyl-phosphate reductase
MVCSAIKTPFEIDVPVLPNFKPDRKSHFNHQGSFDFLRIRLYHTDMHPIATIIIGQKNKLTEHLIHKLFLHPQFLLSHIHFPDQKETSTLANTFTSFVGIDEDMIIDELDTKKWGRNAKLVFLTSHHEKALSIAMTFRAMGLTIIDLTHESPEILKELADQYDYQNYLVDDCEQGLPEISQEKAKRCHWITIPQSHMTSITFALAPLIQNQMISLDDPISVKSFVNQLMSSEDAISIESQLTHFTHEPHIKLHIEPGAGQKGHMVITVKPRRQWKLSDLEGVVSRFYNRSSLVNVLDSRKHERLSTSGFPTFQMLFRKRPDSHDIEIHTSLDPLEKGSVSQAIQMANILFDLPETTGLI